MMVGFGEDRADPDSDETTADRLTITAGGMQGLDLFCKIFVDAGDLVTVGDVRQRALPYG